MDPEFTASIIVEDLPAAVDGLLLGVEMAAGSTRSGLLNVPSAFVVRDDVSLIWSSHVVTSLG
jgi:hypothetical protein